MTVAPSVVATEPSMPRRLLPVAGLLLLSPFCAEFLIGYQGPVVNPVALLVGLLLTAPLYGTVAVLIRDVTRRGGRGWPTILLLAAAFGLIQAGLIDQTLFNHGAFHDGPYWQSLSTRIPGVDVDASQLLVFVGGHVIWSFAAPIAVVEACVPQLADRPWLGRVGTTVLVMLYLAGAAFFLHELVVAPKFHADPGHLVGTAAVVIALGVAAFAIPRRRHPVPRRRAPRTWQVGGVTLLLLGTDVMVSDTGGWLGVVAATLALAACGLLLLRWSAGPGWDRRHVLVVAGAALMLYAALAFVVDPLGASHLTKYVSSGVVLACVLALLAWAYHRVHRAEREAGGACRRGSPPPGGGA